MIPNFYEMTRPLRLDSIRQKSFAIIEPQTIEEIIVRSKRILEVGAGTGAWAAAIAERGADIIATDVANGKNNYGQNIGSFFPVTRMEAFEAVVRNPDRDVLMVWPCYNSPWADRAAAEIRPGCMLFYIGEGDGGCTGDDGFHERLATEFDALDEIEIQQWAGLHDQLFVYRRR